MSQISDERKDIVNSLGKKRMIISEGIPGTLAFILDPTRLGDRFAVCKELPLLKKIYPHNFDSCANEALDFRFDLTFLLVEP